MLFKSYIRLLKKYHKNRISDAELCANLFDSVIYNIKDNEEFNYYDKSVVSLLLNGKRSFPAKIRNHIYDDSVSEDIASYFDDTIVPKLLKPHDNLVQQLLSVLEEYPDISKPHLNTIKQLAKKETLGSFLAEIFRFSIIEGSVHEDACEPEIDLCSNVSNISDNTDKFCPLRLAGICGNNISDKAVIELFCNIDEYSRDKIADKLSDLYNEISNIHFSDSYKSSYLDPSCFSLRRREEISDDQKEIMRKIADLFEIVISDDFFDLGNLENEISMSEFVFETFQVHGTDIELKKYNLINEAYNIILDFLDKLPLINAFKDVRLVRLAMRNTSNNYDENVKIMLEFEKDALLTFQDISAFDPRVFNYIVKNGVNNVFPMRQVMDCFNYESSRKKPRAAFIPYWYKESISQVTNSEMEEELANQFRYLILPKDGVDIVVLEIDEILPNTSVAFPSFVLLKKDIEEIRYSICSRNITSQIEQSIKLEIEP